MNDKKYELIPDGSLFRLRALRDFGNVKKGDIGGAGAEVLRRDPAALWAEHVHGAGCDWAALTPAVVGEGEA